MQSGSDHIIDDWPLLIQWDCLLSVQIIWFSVCFWLVQLHNIIFTLKPSTSPSPTCLYLIW